MHPDGGVDRAARGDGRAVMAAFPSISALFVGLSATNLGLYSKLTRPLPAGLGLDPAQAAIVCVALAIGPMASPLIASLAERRVKRAGARLGFVSAFCSLTVVGLALVLNPAIPRFDVQRPPGGLDPLRISAIGALTFAVGAITNATLALTFDLIMSHRLRGRGGAFLVVRAFGSVAYILGGLSVLFINPFALAATSFAGLALLGWATGAADAAESDPAVRPDQAFGGGFDGRRGSLLFFVLVASMAAFSRSYEAYSLGFIGSHPALERWASAILMGGVLLEPALLVLSGRLVRSVPLAGLVIAAPVAWGAIFTAYFVGAKMGSAWPLLILPLQATNCLFGTIAAMLANARVDTSKGRGATTQSLVLGVQALGALFGSAIGVLAPLNQSAHPEAWAGLWGTCACLAIPVVGVAIAWAIRTQPRPIGGVDDFAGPSSRLSHRRIPDALGYPARTGGSRV